MKNIVLLGAMIAILAFSCDGRQTKKEALEKAVAVYNLTNKPEIKLVYHPENHVKIATDTIFKNKISVRITNYSMDADPILLSDEVINNNHTKTYQRVFESEIIISFANKDILSTRLSANQMSKHEVDPFWATATLQHAWVNQELSSKKEIILEVSFVNPLDKAFKVYRMSIDAIGQKTFHLIEENS